MLLLLSVGTGAAGAETAPFILGEKLSSHQLISVARFIDGRDDHPPTRLDGCRLLLLMGPRGRLEQTYVSFGHRAGEKTRYRSAPEEASNEFALRLMLEREVITAEQYPYYLRVIEQIDLRQLTIIELHDLHQNGDKGFWADPEAFFSRRSVKDVVIFDTETSGQRMGTFYSGFRRSNLWLISGQIADGSTWRRAPLPWMTEFQDFGRSNWDFAKAPHVWELGRGASLDPWITHLNLALATVMAVSELDAMGGKPEQAFITLHATNERNASHFKNHYGFESVGIVSQAPYHEILKIPLLQLLERNPPQKLLKNVDEVMRGTKLGPLQAIQLLSRASRLRDRRPGVFHPAVSVYIGPIEIQDHSHAMRDRYRALAASFNLQSAESDWAVDFLVTRRRPFDSSDIEEMHRSSLDDIHQSALRQGAVLVGGAPAPNLPLAYEKLPSHYYADASFYTSRLSFEHDRYGRDPYATFRAPREAIVKEANQETMLIALHDFASAHGLTLTDERLRRQTFIYLTVAPRDEAAMEAALNPDDGPFCRGGSNDTWPIPYYVKVTGEKLVELARKKPEVWARAQLARPRAPDPTSVF